MMLRFYFERIQGFDGYNLITCNDMCGMNPRIGVSPIAGTLLRKSKTQPAQNKPNPQIATISFIRHSNHKFIIPVGVGPAPWHWCGPDSNGVGVNRDNPEQKNLFSFISEEKLEAIRNGQGYLLIDQAHEGYHAPWLFDWFHTTCNDYRIPPSQIIYITGDIEAGDRYKQWASSKNLLPEMCVVGYPHFEDVIYEVSKGYHEFGIPHPGKIELRKLPDFDYQMAFKKFNPSSIKTFNVLQKRTRAHRMWFYKYLHDAGLVKNNIVSMNKFSWQESFAEDRHISEEQAAELNATLPLMPIENPESYTLENFESGDGGQYICKISDITMLKTWCTVVSEASCLDSEGNCFISEKTFKPIACQHPFIVLGSKGVLKNLQKLGYKTFHPYINEGYDDLPTFERMEYIIREMQRIQQMSVEDKINWYYDIEGILKYNFRHLANRSKNYVFELCKILTDHIEKSNDNQPDTN